LAPFFSFFDTEVAAAVINAALENSFATSIGEVGLPGTDAYNIGVVTFILDPPVLEPVQGIAVIRSANQAGNWASLGENFLLYYADERTWAVFTPVPEPGTALVLASGLIGLGCIGRRRLH
jgi:hypothetical protein